MRAMCQSPERKENITPDVMGIVLRDYIKGVRDKTLVLRDDGFCSGEQIERYFKGYPDWCEVERRLLGEIKGSVLEIGCNIGAHLGHLQKEGLEATGIDISPEAIVIAEERGVKNCLVMDARELLFNERFDTVLILYYGFGLAGTIEEEKQMLRNLYGITNSNGKIICSSIDALKTRDPRHLAYQEFNRRKGKPYGDITQVTLRMKHGDRIGEWYNLLFINPNGLPQLIENTGWEVNQVIPEKEGSRAWYYILGK